MAKQRILVVEDEDPIREGLIDVFVYHGYQVDAVADGEQGLEQALTGEYHLIILDVMLPGLDGFTICNKIRESDREQPIIMLTAKNSKDDIIAGLRLGADDYIPKPFSVQELVLRVEAVLRRSFKLGPHAWELVLGDYISIDTRNLVGRLLAKHEVREEIVEFTRREVDILKYLMENDDRPVSRDELLSMVWGYKNAASVETRTVDIHIAKIRRKIEPEPKEPIFLVTVRGEGYRLMAGVAHGAG